MNLQAVLFATSVFVGWMLSAHAQDRIVHDGKFEFLRQQHGERWDAEDEEVDLEPGEEWTQAHYIAMNERYQRQTLEQL